MATFSYFCINGINYSHLVNQLKIETNHNYTSQSNAAGNTVVDFINTKRTIEVGIIPITDADYMQEFKTELDKFNVTISFLNPQTNKLEDNVNCIIPSNNIEYYTIQGGTNIMYKAFTLKFIEL